MTKKIYEILIEITTIFAVLSVMITPIARGSNYELPVQLPIIEEAPEVEKYAISENGQSPYVIVKGENCSESEATAAETLQSYLYEIGNVNLPIITDEQAPEDFEIIIGKTNREGNEFTVDRDTLGDEGVYIKTIGNNIVISGGELRGTLYAVYTFLENYLDCRWFSKDLTVIPEAESIMIPTDIDYQYKPSLEYRDTSWMNIRDKEWSLANKLNSLVRAPINDSSIGGGIGYAGSASHSLERGRLISDADYEEFPEIMAFGVQSGELTKNHPCLSSEKTYEIVLNNVYNWLDTYSDRQIVSVTHPDNTDYCVCDDCSAVYEEEGSTAGMMIRFVNRIADDVAEHYPDRDILVDTFAYQYTRKAPLITVPRDNVIVRLCSIECCFVHPLNDPSCEQNVDFAKDLKDWKEICDNLYIWDYTTNFHNYNLVFPNFNVLQPNMQFYVENSAIGMYAQGNSMSTVANGEFGELRSYILAKLLWDQNVDIHKYTREFCEAYYGEAANEIMEYIALFCYRAENSNLLGIKYHSGISYKSNHPVLSNLSGADISYINDLWETAKSKDLTPQQTENVRKSEISWRIWKAGHHCDEFSLLQRWQTKFDNARALTDDMRALGITKLSEGREETDLSDNPNFMRVPEYWRVKEDGQFMNPFDIHYVK